MKTVHVFYACDGAFLRYAAVSIASLMANASPRRRYVIHILYSEIGEDSRALLPAGDDRFRIVFDDVSAFMQTLKEKLPIRDYYSKTTYYRLFISEIYPFLDKAIYLDADTVVLGDISELWELDLGGAYVGATVEQVMAQNEVFGNYVENVLGVSRDRYFNAGVLVLNCKRMRKKYVLEQFADLLNAYRFTVTQDEDYLNVICQGKVKYLPGAWNLQTYGKPVCPVKEAKLIHYVMTCKPWHYPECPHGDLFWRYAAMTPCYDELQKELADYSDLSRAADGEAENRLLELAKSEIGRSDNYLNAVVRRQKAPDRLEILEKIREYERTGRFDEDVENDPPAPVLMPDQIDYLHAGPIEKICTGTAKISARLFLNRLLKEKKMILKEIRGIEHFRELSSGAIITCNHFNALDSFAIQMAYDAAEQKRRRFYRIIREGNYTNFPGFYGFLMRHYDTLPLSSNSQTMRKFIRATDRLLQDGNFILIYPEQSMWWNYRKPKPLKPGGFSMAAKNKVPVLPCFITMKDSPILGEDGFFVQEYTIHVGAPIRPDPAKSYRENVQSMMEQNFAFWRKTYEHVYGLPLTYETECGSAAPERQNDRVASSPS